MAKGFGVSLDWLVFGSDAAGEIVTLVVERSATETAQRVFDVLVQELLKGARPVVSNGELFNMSVEEWSSSIGHDAAEFAKRLVDKGVTSQQLKLWQAQRKDLLSEIVQTRYERFKAGEHTSSGEP